MSFPGKKNNWIFPKKDTKLIMTLLVRDEQDIIRENIEFHLSQGVSFFIVTDNLSTDGTAAILKEYEERGSCVIYFKRVIVSIKRSR